MTKVQIHFRLREPLNDEMMAKLSDANGIYGIQRIRVAPDLGSLMVEYDASRLRPAEVEAALACAGIAAEPQ
jgi:hypothetical protein